MVTDHYAKVLLQGRAALKEIDLNQVSITHTHPVALPLSIAPDVAFAASTLKMHLFVNKTSRELITSDDPVVIHNQYCEGVSGRGVLGWQCAGIQVALPISPDHLLFLFDGDVYKVGSAHKGIDVSLINDEGDVEQWNALQILNSLENVYFRGEESVSAIERLCHSMAKHRPLARTRFVETGKIPTGDGKFSSLIAHYDLLLPHNLTVRDVQVRRNAKRIPLSERANLYRDQPDQSFPSPKNRHGDEVWRRYEVDKIVDK